MFFYIIRYICKLFGCHLKQKKAAGLFRSPAAHEEGVLVPLNRRWNKPKAKPAVGSPNLFFCFFYISGKLRGKVQSKAKIAASQDGSYLKFLSNSTYSAEVRTPSL